LAVLSFLVTSHLLSEEKSIDLIFFPHLKSRVVFQGRITIVWLLIIFCYKPLLSGEKSIGGDVLFVFEKIGLFST
jgi:hypothetical protein